MNMCATMTAMTQQPTSECLPVLRLDGHQQHHTADAVIAEVPVAMVYNGISHAVLLASPSDLPDFALGFSLSEGILQQASELYDCEMFASAQGIELRLEIASARFATLKDRRRHMAGRTGCGLCGVDSLDAVAQTLPTLTTQPDLSHAAIVRALAAFPDWQPLHRATGAAHGAAFCTLEGDIVLAREDVGRHNALDKLIGGVHRHPIDRTHGFALVSSRASYEMVQKTVMAGIPALIAVSAPTAYAVALAQQSGLLLAGFARTGRLVVYSQPERLRPQP